MIHPLLLIVGLLLPPHVERAWRHHAQADRTSRPQQAVVTARAVSDFLEWARQRKPGSVVDVWKRAAEVFPRGSVIEGYPESIGDPASKRSLSARYMISKQLERDGITVEDVETVVLFFGDDGSIQRDVVLVVSKITRRVIGVYQAFHGR